MKENNEPYYSDCNKYQYLTLQEMLDEKTARDKKMFEAFSFANEEEKTVFLLGLINYSSEKLAKSFPENIHHVILDCDEQTQKRYMYHCLTTWATIKAFPTLNELSGGLGDTIKQNINSILNLFKYNCLVRCINEGIPTTLSKIDTEVKLYEQTGFLMFQNYIIKPHVCSPNYVASVLNMLKMLKELLKEHINNEEIPEKQPQQDLTHLSNTAKPNRTYPVLNTDALGRKKLKFLGTPAQLAQLFHAFSVKNWMVLERSGEGTAKVLLDFIEFEKNNPSIDSLGKKFQLLNRDEDAINKEDASLFLKIPHRNDLKR